MINPYYETILATLKKCQEDDNVSEVIVKPYSEFKNENIIRVTIADKFLGLDEQLNHKILTHETQSAARALRILLLRSLNYSNPTVITWADLKEKIKSSPNNNYWMTDEYTDSEDNLVYLEPEFEELCKSPNVLVDGRLYVNPDTNKFTKSIASNTVIELLHGNQVITEFYGYRMGTALFKEEVLDYLEILAKTYIQNPTNIQIYKISITKEEGYPIPPLLVD